MNKVLENIKGKLIVSCQALEDEPLHSSFIMGRMAYAAFVGGAGGSCRLACEKEGALREQHNKQ